ncbi:hypothetical protein NJ7G_2560 [Natrinema sp. J7-2]|nr:hypothetical protein NJ7G_2560 [Natrinema sp. J7-2]
MNGRRRHGIAARVTTRKRSLETPLFRVKRADNRAIGCRSNAFV